jgi:hypothetical protein
MEEQVGGQKQTAAKANDTTQRITASAAGEIYADH